MSPPTKTEGDVVVAVLRLAHKYDVHFLRRCALEHLSTMFCMSLEDYHDGSTASYTFHSFADGVLKTIKVLVEVDALWMLPDAYYSLFSPGLQAILSAGASWDGLGKSEKTNRLRLFSHSVQMQPCTTSLSFLSLSSIEDPPCKDPRICNQDRASLPLRPSR